MSIAHRPVRVRYPFRAVAVVALAALFFLAELAALALFMMPLIPLVPVFVTVMVGQACLLSSIVEYAASLARSEPVHTSGAEANR
ncbi:MAG TPA: hypothetical protein VGK73_10430, partial [Polyangiaceae bacterium]